MTLNATGTISANSGVAGTNIALEFGWTPPFSLATKTPRGGVATSAFNLSAFYGKSNSTGTIVSPFITWNAIGSSTPGVNAIGSVVFNSNGTVTGANINGSAGSPNWITPTTTGIGAGYWVRFTVTTGTASINQAATWTNLASSLYIRKSSITGAQNCTFTIEVATDAAGAHIVLTSPGNIVGYDHAG